MLLGEGDVIGIGDEDLGFGFGRVFKKAVSFSDPRKLVAQAVKASDPRNVIRRADPRAVVRRIDPRPKAVFGRTMVRIRPGSVGIHGEDLGFSFGSVVKGVGKGLDPRTHLAIAKKGLTIGHQVGVGAAKMTTGMAVDAVKSAASVTMGAVGKFMPGGGGGGGALPPCGFFDNILNLFRSTPTCE